LLGVVTAVVVIGALYFARVVLTPLALAILVAVVLTPAVSFLERRRLRRSVAILFVLVGVVGIATLVGWTVLPQFAQLTYQLPHYERAIQEKVDALKGTTTTKLSNASDSVKALEKDITDTSGRGASDQAKNVPTPGSSPARPLSVQMVPAANPLESAAGVLTPVATALVVLVFAVFILAGREDLRNRLIKLTSGGRLTLMTQAMDEAWNRITRYLFMQMIVNASYGVMTGVALHFLGVPKAALWGFIAGVLRYLPYIGWPTAALMPSALALAVFPGWWHAIATAGIFVGLEMLLANGVEPMLYGAHVGLAPLAILVSAVFWTLIWGFPGLLLATPMSVCLTVLGRYVPSLGFLSILLGSEPVMDAHAQYYQRLLAGDQNEARQILETYVKQSSLEELYNNVVIPALARSEEDGHRNELDEQTRDFIDSTTRELAEELAESYPPPNATKLEPVRSPRGGRVEVVCVPARDEADDVVGMLLCQLLERHGVKAQSVSIAPAAEMVAQVLAVRPETVCISALPPLTMNHTRALYAKLRMEAPGVRIAVCLWQLEGDPEKTVKLLKLAPQDAFFVALPDVLRHFAPQEGKVEAEVAPQEQAISVDSGLAGR
jgi:predicted PurR-regulated permease PerM